VTEEPPFVGDDDWRQSAEAELRSLAGKGDGAIDIAGAALVLASFDRPRVDLARYRRHLAALASEVGALAPSPAGTADCAAALSDVIAERYGYDGDRLSYDDLQNSNLIRVIDRRRGLPVALGILYIHAARAQGWGMVGLAFPGHFLLRLEHRRERAVLDPFNKGRICGAADLRSLLKSVAGEAAELAAEHYAEVSDREILLRLENNAKLRLLRADQPERALAVLERMLMFAPDRPELWYELGLVQAQLGKLRAAVEALERCLSFEARSELRHRAAALLYRLRGKLN
jgi:regulator of sirC expression with transglutaminase-like and TPR domain